LGLIGVPCDANAVHRLPAGFHWGRCLLEIDGKKYITGRCAYEIGPGASFEFHGPHQIWAGIDYKPEDFAGEQSNDYFASIDVEGSTADGFWNENIRATHAQAFLGTLRRRGACWVNERAKVCLWRK